MGRCPWDESQARIVIPLRGSRLMERPREDTDSQVMERPP